jgi:hypothetical protein
VSVETRAPRAAYWPYPVLGPLFAALPFVVQLLKSPAAILPTLLVSYLVCTIPALMLAAAHRHLHLTGARHRFLPILLLALVLGLVLGPVLYALGLTSFENIYDATFRLDQTRVLMELSLALMACAGYISVILINRRTGSGHSAAPISSYPDVSQR